MKIVTVKKNTITGMLMGSSDEPVKIILAPQEAPKPGPPPVTPKSTTIVSMLVNSSEY